jgi:hypothetical protein
MLSDGDFYFNEYQLSDDVADNGGKIGGCRGLKLVVYKI